MKRLLKILLGFIVMVAGLFFIKIKPKTVIFGHFAGECVGNCGTIYHISEKRIIRDTTTFGETYNDLTKFSVKHQNILEEDEGNYNNFKLNIPLIMLLEPRARFGCPDCHDQGGYYLEISMFGITRRFQIDKGHEPFYYKNLTKDIDNKIETIVELKQYGR